MAVQKVRLDVLVKFDDSRSNGSRVMPPARFLKDDGRTDEWVQPTEHMTVGGNAIWLIAFKTVLPVKSFVIIYVVRVVMAMRLLALVLTQWAQNPNVFASRSSAGPLD